jgi:tetratricopeptide (TPR) repeat protein
LNDTFFFSAPQLKRDPLGSAPMANSTRDWFRKAAWSAEDQRDFRDHLKRARSKSRPQYLRIQAAHLLDNGLPEPALSLLDEFLAAPDDLFLTLGHSLRARALTDLGQLDNALSAYRAAIEAQRRRPNIQAYAALEFAELVVATQRRVLFSDALELLDELHANDPFPEINYREAAVRAQIAHAVGDPATARREAQRALHAANAATAPFARHPDVGLVRGVDPEVYAKLEAMCAA